jgi:hypothetical protein
VWERRSTEPKPPQPYPRGERPELQQFLSFVPYAWYKTYGRPSAADPCTPRAKQPPRQPRTLSVTVVGCSMDIWARTLRVDRGMDGFRGPSGAHFVVCSLLVSGPIYQILPSRRFCATETPRKRNTWLRNGWMIGSHQPPTMISH